MPHIPATSLQTRNNSDKLLYVDISTTWLGKSTKNSVLKYRKIAIERQNTQHQPLINLYDHIKIGPGSSQKDQFKKMKGLSVIENNGKGLNNAKPRFALIVGPLIVRIRNYASKISKIGTH